MVVNPHHWIGQFGWSLTIDNVLTSTCGSSYQSSVRHTSGNTYALTRTMTGIQSRFIVWMYLILTLTNPDPALQFVFQVPIMPSRGQILRAGNGGSNCNPVAHASSVGIEDRCTSAQVNLAFCEVSRKRNFASDDVSIAF